MKHWVYGSVAVSALVLASGGLAAACGQHARMTSLQAPAAAVQAADQQRYTIAQQDSDKSTTGEDSKEKSDDSK